MLTDTCTIERSRINAGLLGQDPIYQEEVKKARKADNQLLREARRAQGNPFYFCIKRTFDIVFSSLAIIMLAPLLALIAILVKATSKGPVFFLDKRVGKNNKDIKVYKFRSMYVDAESRLRDYLTDEQMQKWIVERKLDNDPRITKFGKFIRKTSLDELPQLFNIFKGDMSFVGPRPITRIELDENYNTRQKRLLLSATPGLTGYWQVYARSAATYETGERQKLELAYFSKRSCLFDAKLVLMTVPAVLQHKGAQ
ncbi:MAG: sugar transferase [Bacilli bacterium]|jgi:lipopolysaccharide/colanic/teichoic acid biosynthesis glycosyltransferase